MKKAMFLFGIIAMAMVMLAPMAYAGGCRDKKHMIDGRCIITIMFPDGETVSMADNIQKLPNWLTPLSHMKVNIAVRGDVTQEDVDVAKALETGCRDHVKTIRPNPLVTVLSSGVLYGAAGFAGGGAGSQAFPGAAFKPYGMDYAAAMGLSGMANGIISLGVEKRYILDNCAAIDLGLTKKYKERIRVLSSIPY
jgi:hypothetical protein